MFTPKLGYNTFTVSHILTIYSKILRVQSLIKSLPSILLITIISEMNRGNAIGGTAWTLYSLADNQIRSEIWIVPLFILIGSFQFARLKLLNTVFVPLQLIADSFTSIYNLLTKLATQQEIYRMWQNSSLPDSAKKSVAILLAAYEDWDTYFLYVSTQNGKDLAKKKEVQ